MPFRLALVGAGRIGAFHAATLAASTDVEVVAVVEPVAAAAAAVGTEATQRFHDLDELVAYGEFDGALIAAPTALHRQLVVRLAQERIPVLCEKPCGRNLEDARAIAAVVAANDAFVRVAFWRRHVPELRHLRQRIANGELGHLSTVISIQFDEKPPSAVFRDPARSGGLLVDVGVHDFDLLRWLTGQSVTEGHGFFSSVNYEKPIEGDPESASLVVAMSDGATGLVSIGRRHPPGELQALKVIGTADAVSITYVRNTPEADQVMGAAFRAQTEAFARAVHDGEDANLATVEDAIAALETADKLAVQIALADR